MQKDIIVQQSKKHGKGVFAARDFKKGEVVFKWNYSKTYTKDDTKKLSLEEKKVLSQLENGNYITVGIPGIYVNHSCNANTKIKGDADIAARNITKGEEITSDYSKEDYPVQFICHCGSKQCKKIVGKNEI